MKTSLITAALATAALALSQALTSCAGVAYTASTPYGDVSSLDGQVHVAIRPLVIATK